MRFDESQIKLIRAQIALEGTLQDHAHDVLMSALPGSVLDAAPKPPTTRSGSARASTDALHCDRLPGRR